MLSGTKIAMAGAVLLGGAATWGVFHWDAAGAAQPSSPPTPEIARALAPAETEPTRSELDGAQLVTPKNTALREGRTALATPATAPLRGRLLDEIDGELLAQFELQLTDANGGEARCLSNLIGANDGIP